MWLTGNSCSHGAWWIQSKSSQSWEDDDDDGDEIRHQFVGDDSVVIPFERYSGSKVVVDMSLPHTQEGIKIKD